MLDNRSMPRCTVIPEPVYDNVGEAVERLCPAFGFRERWRAGDDRAQLAFGDGAVVVTERRAGQGLARPGRHVLRALLAAASLPAANNCADFPVKCPRWPIAAAAQRARCRATYATSGAGSVSAGGP